MWFQQFSATTTKFYKYLFLIFTLGKYFYSIVVIIITVLVL